MGSVQNIYSHERRRLIFTFVTFSWQQILDEFELAYFIWKMNLETILVLNNLGAFVCTDVSLKFAGGVLLH